MPSNAYSQFVKKHIHEFNHLGPKDRMRACAKLYIEMGGKPAIKSNEKIVKTVRGKKVTVPEGGSIFGDIIPFGHLLGLGLKTKDGKKMQPKNNRKRGGTLTNATMTASGGNFLDDFAQGFAMPFKAVASILPAISHLI